MRTAIMRRFLSLVHIPVRILCIYLVSTTLKVILTKTSVLSNVFLGLALDKENENDESEKAYNVAARAKASDPLVWQGLITLYEKQAHRKLGEYHDSALHLAGIYMEAYVIFSKSLALGLLLIERQ